MILLSGVFLLFAEIALCFVLPSASPREYTDEIHRLKKVIDNLRSKEGCIVDKNNLKQLKEQIADKTELLDCVNPLVDELKREVDGLSEFLSKNKSSILKSKTKSDECEQIKHESEDIIQMQNDMLYKTYQQITTIKLLCDELDKKLQQEKSTASETPFQTSMLQDSNYKSAKEIKLLEDKLKKVEGFAKKNYKKSAEFKQNFHENLNDMNEKIEQMAEEHIKYTKKIQDNIATTNKMFSAHANRMSTLVSKLVLQNEMLMTNVVSSIHDYASSEQLWATETIKEVTEEREVLIGSFRSFLIEIFIPILNAMHMTTHGLLTSIQENANDVLVVINKQEETWLFRFSEIKELVQTYFQNTEFLLSGHRIGLNACGQYLDKKREQQLELRKIFEDNFKTVEHAFSVMKMSFTQFSNLEHEETSVIKQNIEGIVTDGKRLKEESDQVVQKYFQQTEELESASSSQFKDIASAVSKRECKVRKATIDVIAKCETVKTEFISFCQQMEQRSLQSTQQLEGVLREHADNKIRHLQENIFHIQKMDERVRSSAEGQENILENYKLDYEAQVIAQKYVTDCLSASYKKWQSEFSACAKKHEDEAEMYFEKLVWNDEGFDRSSKEELKALSIITETDSDPESFSPIEMKPEQWIKNFTHPEYSVYFLDTSLDQNVDPELNNKHSNILPLIATSVTDKQLQLTKPPSFDSVDEDIMAMSLPTIEARGRSPNSQIFPANPNGNVFNLMENENVRINEAPSMVAPIPELQLSTLEKKIINDCTSQPESTACLQSTLRMNKWIGLMLQESPEKKSLEKNT